MESYTACLGIDASLSGTGVCRVEFTQNSLKVVELDTIKTKPSIHQYARISRYQLIREKIFSGKEFEKCFIVIEGYSFFARGSAATALPELGGLLRNECQVLGIPWIEIPPTSVKKFGTGSGAAKKDLVLMKIQQKYEKLLKESSFELKDSNQADALTMAIFGATLARLKQFQIEPDKIQLEVIKNMDKERFYQLGYDSLV